MSGKIVLEDQAILLYRRIANEIFRKDFGTEMQEAMMKITGFDKVIEALSESSVSMKIDEIISDSINASLHTLLHWAAEYQPSEDNETSRAVGLTMQGIVEMTMHLCPAFKDEQ